MNMHKMKILQLTTYPIDNPNHGGKLRCHNIRKSLISFFDVKTLSIYIDVNDSIEDFQITLNTQEFVNIVGHEIFLDWGINKYLEQRKILKDQIFKNIKEYDPHILLIEQIYLWPLVQEMIDKGYINKDVFIIYSSQNIEYPMKKEIYKKFFSEDQLNGFVNIVKEIEYDIINNAHMILTVSEHDRDIIKEINPKSNLYVYKNGHERIKYNERYGYWEEAFSHSKRNYVFVGSWHGPNISGLYQLVQNGITEYDNEELTLWVMGGSGLGLLDIYSIILPDNTSLKIVGDVSDEDINSAILLSTAIVLPIWEGGGSNLKTAQALLSGKKIIATPFAFRGFEIFMDENEVYLADEPIDLIKLMMCTQYKNKMVNRTKLIDSLIWENILELLAKDISNAYINYKK